MKRFIKYIGLSFNAFAASALLSGNSVASSEQPTPSDSSPHTVIADASQNNGGKDRNKTGTGIIQPNSSWAVAFDNDILVPGSRDQDYTYGLNVTFSGKKAAKHWASLHKPLKKLDDWLGVDNRIDDSITANRIEYGLFGFTPEDISQTEANSDDRPYASLLYVSSSREQYDQQNEESWQSTLTLGILGLSVVGKLQEAVHSATSGDSPEGWDNQISDGGEITARYSVAKQKLIYDSQSGVELKTTWQGSIGYITEASWSLSARAGKIHTPWISFNPELTSYGEKSTPNATSRVFEHYAWAGISVKLRAYNAFLQGQFRDSVVSYDSDEVNHGIVEAWAGYTLAFANGYSFTYSMRGHTSEIKEGAADRSVLWGGVLVAKTFG